MRRWRLRALLWRHHDHSAKHDDLLAQPPRELRCRWPGRDAAAAGADKRAQEVLGLSDYSNSVHFDIVRALAQHVHNLLKARDVPSRAVECCPARMTAVVVAAPDSSGAHLASVEVTAGSGQANHGKPGPRNLCMCY
jgi:hypothetical protein